MDKGVAADFIAAWIFHDGEKVRCAAAVPRVSLGRDASPRICVWCLKSLPCGLVAGKSLMSVTIVVENSFRPPNGRLVSFGPGVLFKSSDFNDLPQN